MQMKREKVAPVPYFNCLVVVPVMSKHRHTSLSFSWICPAFCFYVSCLFDQSSRSSVKPDLLRLPKLALPPFACCGVKSDFALHQAAG